MCVSFHRINQINTGCRVIGCQKIRDHSSFYSVTRKMKQNVKSKTDRKEKNTEIGKEKKTRKKEITQQRKKNTRVI